MAPRVVSGPEITGLVTNQQTGTPIGGATVTVSATVYTDPDFTSGTTTLTADGSGVFFCYASRGTYTFTTTAVGAGPIESVTVRGGGGPSSGASVSDATTGAKGIVQLAGDLAGTAASPTVPGLATKVPALTPTAVKTADYAAAAGDLALIDVTAANVAVTLPTTPADKTRVAVKVVARAAGFAGSVVCGGSSHFNITTGSTTRSLSLTGESAICLYQASNDTWIVTDGDTPVSQLDTRYIYGLAVGRGTCVVPVSPRAHAAYDQQDITSTTITYHHFMPLTDPGVLDVLPVYGNGQSIVGISGDYEETTTPITIAAAVMTSDNQIMPFTFNGQHTVTIPGGAWVAPDAPVSCGAQITINDKFGNPTLTGCWMRTYVSVPGPRSDAATTTSGSSVIGDTSILAADAGKYVTGTGIPANSYVGAVTAGTSFVLMSALTKAAVNATATGSPTISLKTPIPLNLAALASLDNLTVGTGPDMTLAGTTGNVSGGSGSFYYGPALLLGRPRRRVPIVTCVTDSIMDGYSDDFHSPYYGPIARACQALGLPLVKLARGGETAGTWSTPLGRRHRASLADGATHALVAIGTNDGLANVAGLATLQARLVTIGTWLNTMGIKVYLSTVPPRTTSTDAWATTGNQTPVSGSLVAQLATLNDWVRALPAPYVGFFDLADLCMSARNSGLWAAGATTDGVHPTDTLLRGTITTATQTLMATWSL